jgi:hypothetical protein
MTIDPVQRTGNGVVRHGGSHHFASPSTCQTQAFHQSLNRAASDTNPLAVQLMPDFVGTINLLLLCQTRLICGIKPTSRWARTDRSDGLR